MQTLARMLNAMADRTEGTSRVGSDLALYITNRTERSLLNEENDMCDMIGGTHWIIGVLHRKIRSGSENIRSLARTLFENTCGHRSNEGSK